MFLHGQHVLAGIFGTVAKKTQTLLFTLFQNVELQAYFAGEGVMPSSVQQVGSKKNFPTNVQNGNLTVNTLLLPKAVSLDFEVVITYAKPHFIHLPTDLHTDCKLTSTESCN